MSIMKTSEPIFTSKGPTVVRTSVQLKWQVQNCKLTPFACLKNVLGWWLLDRPSILDNDFTQLNSIRLISGHLSICGHFYKMWYMNEIKIHIIHIFKRTTLALNWFLFTIQPTKKQFQHNYIAQQFMIFLYIISWEACSHNILHTKTNNFSN